MTPDFAEFLQSVPEAQRRGKVFEMLHIISGNPLPAEEVLRQISNIGRKAGVVVTSDIERAALKLQARERGQQKASKQSKKAMPKKARPLSHGIKYASVHDLRRSFGHRWGQRVTTAVLEKLMRHASIQTTMEFYASQDAQSVAELIWGAGSPQLST